MCLVIPTTSCQQRQQDTILLETTNKNKEMNSSRPGMTMEQGQDDYFNQQSIRIILPAYINPLMSSIYVGRLWVGLLIEIIILSLFFLNHCHSYVHSCSFPWNVLSLVNFIFLLKLDTGYVQLWHCIEAGCLTAPRTLPGVCLLLGYHYDYALHRSPYTVAHILIMGSR